MVERATSGVIFVGCLLLLFGLSGREQPFERQVPTYYRVRGGLGRRPQPHTALPMVPWDMSTLDESEVPSRAWSRDETQRERPMTITLAELDEMKDDELAAAAAPVVPATTAAKAALECGARQLLPPGDRCRTLTGSEACDAHYFRGGKSNAKPCVWGRWGASLVCIAGRARECECERCETTECHRQCAKSDSTPAAAADAPDKVDDNADGDDAETEAAQEEAEALAADPAARAATATAEAAELARMEAATRRAAVPTTAESVSASATSRTSADVGGVGADGNGSGNGTASVGPVIHRTWKRWHNRTMP